MQFISNKPRTNTKTIALYNREQIDGTYIVHNSPYSFKVTGCYGIIGAWSPIKISFDVYVLKFLHVNIFDEENHLVFSDGLFLYWFITDKLNKLIRIQETEKSDYEVWEINQSVFTPERVREHKNNVKLLNSNAYKNFREEILLKGLS
jgi:hypothetical protein